MIAHPAPRQRPPGPSILREAELLGRLPNETFDGLARLATRLLHLPVALVTASDGEREVILGGAGVPHRRAVPLSASFTQDLVESRGVLLVGDVRESQQLRCSSLLRELQMVACAGVPVRAGGRVQGHLCVLSAEPREWRPEEIDLLRQIAALAGRQIELRVELRRARAGSKRQRVRMETLLATTDRFRDLVERSLAGIYLIQDGRLGYVNPRMAEIFGYPLGELVGMPVTSLVAEEDRARVRENLRRRVEGEV